MKKILTLLVVILGIFVSCSNEKTEKTDSSAKEGSKKILVVYFSATGNTKRIAQIIASDKNADIFEIVPESPYTAEDLNSKNPDSKVVKEKADKSIRPKIKNSVENFSQYDVVFLGYPIWWGEAPRIMNTFVENNDFNGKTVIPFVTSGSSEIGTSPNPLKEKTKGAAWKEGKRFSGSSSEADVKKWIKGLGL